MNINKIYLLFNPNEYSRVIIICFLMFMGLLTDLSVAQTIISGGTNLNIAPGTAVTSLEQLTLQSAATLNNQGTVILKKNLVNQNVTANSLGTGAFVFSGSSAQSIIGQNILQDLTLNNSSGLVIGGNTRINGIFTFTNGLATLGTNNLLMGPSATFSGSPSNAKMVVATEAGQLRKEFPSGFTGNFTFPVGDATSVTEYSPVTIAFNSGTFGTDNFVGVNLVNAQYPGTSISYLNRYWNLNQANITNFSCVATFQYVPADVVGTEADVYCFKVNTVPWSAYNQSNTSAHTIDVHGSGSFGTFTGNKGNGSPPPDTRFLQDVNIGSGQTLCFGAQQIITIAGNGTTFTVQNGGSVNLIAGQTIFMLPGTRVYVGGYLHGYITTNGTYCTVPSNPIEVNPVEPKSDSSIALENLNNGFIRIYPNPTNGKFMLEFSDNLVGGMVNTEIFGIRGEKLFSEQITGDKKHEFSLAGRPVGVYFVKVVVGEEVKTIKLILTR